MLGGGGVSSVSLSLLERSCLRLPSCDDIIVMMGGGMTLFMRDDDVRSAVALPVDSPDPPPPAPPPDYNFIAFVIISAAMRYIHCVVDC
jgi:hypothetical protein